MNWTVSDQDKLNIAIDSVIIPCGSVEEAIEQNRLQTTPFPIHLDQNAYNVFANCFLHGVSLHSQGSSCLTLLTQYGVPLYDKTLSIISPQAIHWANEQAKFGLTKPKKGAVAKETKKKTQLKDAPNKHGSVKKRGRPRKERSFAPSTADASTSVKITKQASAAKDNKKRNKFSEINSRPTKRTKHAKQVKEEAAENARVEDDNEDLNSISSVSSWSSSSNSCDLDDLTSVDMSYIYAQLQRK
jgi:hypothetical protein